MVVSPNFTNVFDITSQLKSKIKGIILACILTEIRIMALCRLLKVLVTVKYTASIFKTTEGMLFNFNVFDVISRGHLPRPIILA